MLKVIALAIAAWLMIFWPCYIIYTIIKAAKHARKTAH